MGQELTRRGRGPDTVPAAGFSGICASCIHAPVCFYRQRERGSAIWECDLYAGYDAPSLREVTAKYRGQRGAVIAMLQDIQSKYGYLPPGALKTVAEETGARLVDIYAVATFYKHFSLKPRGRHLISVCLGTACHVRGAPAVRDEFQRELGIAAGETTADGEISLETVACLGGCALGPIVVADGYYFSHVKTGDVKKITQKTREGFRRADVKSDGGVFPVDVKCPYCNHSLMDYEHFIDDRPSIRVTVSFGDLHGWVRLSSLYGSYEVESEYEIPANAVVNFFCPHCHAELRGTASCLECGAPVVPMLLRDGGVVEICSRRGCKYHMLDIYAGGAK